MALMLTPKIEAQMRAITLELLREKRGRASIGPADVARTFHGDDWQRWMDTVKEVARKMDAEGLIEATRHGKPTSWPWRGVIRFRNPLAQGDVALRAADDTNATRELADERESDAVADGDAE